MYSKYKNVVSVISFSCTRVLSQFEGWVGWGGHLTYLDLHFIVEEDVAQLQVSVDDSIVVQVLDPFEHLCHEVASLGLSDSLTTLVQLQQGLEET